ncbi:hypothetical protein DICVIV_09607 [Dictyocaulus viviparus]|uniref:Uncharacterized protein n=1 Tax=Dictyocaulus viviparus TaxID=29172 RepID=A0A0D8XKQ9_DICVI|nr:hypothetical protein DICVIV_09607 [Dictyocaulus viviparus]
MYSASLSHGNVTLPENHSHHKNPVDGKGIISNILGQRELSLRGKAEILSAAIEKKISLSNFSLSLNLRYFSILKLFEMLPILFRLLCLLAYILMVFCYERSRYEKSVIHTFDTMEMCMSRCRTMCSQHHSEDLMMPRWHCPAQINNHTNRFYKLNLAGMRVEFRTVDIIIQIRPHMDMIMVDS